MQGGDTPVKIIVMGGDERDIHLINFLWNQGFDVYAIGFDRIGYQIKGKLLNSIQHDDLNFDAIILPITGLESNGDIPTVYSRKKFNFIEETQNISKLPLTLIGKSDTLLREHITTRQGFLIETRDLNDLAIYNSVPTAEGAVLRAIELSKNTIHGSDLLVMGFGRCGITLTRLLINMGAQVTVTARSASQMARANEMTAEVFHIGELYNRVDKYQIIFNTIPDLVVTDKVVGQLREDAVVVDIASGKGGTDFQACRNNNIKAVLEQGIPGKVAPKTAGHILGEVYLRILKTHLGR